MQPEVKVCWVLIDGVGDVSVRAYGGKTPLMASFTPFLDALARSGYSGKWCALASRARMKKHTNTNTLGSTDSSVLPCCIS